MHDGFRGPALVIITLIDPEPAQPVAIGIVCVTAFPVESLFFCQALQGVVSIIAAAPWFLFDRQNIASRIVLIDPLQYAGDALPGQPVCQIMAALFPQTIAIGDALQGAEGDDCQDSCPIFYATFSLTFCSSVSDFSGFNQTSLTGSQFRVSRLQRSGFRCFADS